MSSASITSRGGGRFGVEGVLDFSTVTPLLAEGERLLRGRGRLEIDLQGVSTSNSAGLALLLEWMGVARRRNLNLRYRNLPESLARLAALTNLIGVLPVVKGGA
ncbi:MAG: STAS domain-containing protein [Pseudomonadota bacterium]|nr:STAS domain-containing protein [Pseudomonadota bacterium]